MRSCNCWMTAGLISRQRRASVFASGTFSVPIRAKLRYTKLARTSRSSSSKLQFRICLSSNSRSTTSRRSLRPTEGTAPRMPTTLGFIQHRDQRFVGEHAVSVAHPRLPQVFHFFCEEAGPQRRLLMTKPDHKARIPNQQTFSYINVRGCRRKCRFGLLSRPRIR